MSVSLLESRPTGLPLAGATAAEPDPAAIRRYAWLCAVLLVAMLAAEVVALAGFVPSPLRLFLHTVGSDPCCAVAVGTVCFLHFWSSPGSREFATTGLVALSLAGGLLLAGPRTGLEVHPANALCAGLGAASFMVLGWRAWRGRPAERLRALAVFLPAALITGSMVLSTFFLTLSIALNPTTHDALLYAADEALGQPSFVVGRLFVALPPLASVSMCVYNTVPLAFAALFAAHLRADPTHRRVPLLVFLVAPMVGYAIYQVFPAIGPVFVFGPNYPYAPPSPAELLAAPPVPGFEPRNCMPSLHTTWALLLWWNARPLAAWFRAIMGGYLVFTVLATLGFGVHYAVDLVVAVPFALAAQATLAPALAAPPRRRAAAALFGAALVVGWLLVLRFGVSWVMGWPWLIAAAALLTTGLAYTVEGTALRRSGCA